MNKTLESFAVVGRRYRLLKLIMLVCVVAFMLTCWFCTGAPSRSSAHANLALFLWLIGFSAGIAAKFCLKCTECGSDLTEAKGTHCPGCGTRSLSADGWPRPRWCATCGLRLLYGKGGRKFKVHYCSDCGAHLDERGV